MKAKTINATIEILGKLYPVRCPEEEAASLQEAADFLNKKMLEVQESGKVINLERIAIITALNIAHQLIQLGTQKDQLMGKINQRLTLLQSKLDTSMKKSSQTELLYNTE